MDKVRRIDRYEDFLCCFTHSLERKKKIKEYKSWIVIEYKNIVYRNNSSTPHFDRTTPPNQRNVYVKTSFVFKRF